jgi:hypothetical protein
LNLRGVLIVYNFVQVVFSAWLFHEVTVLWLQTYRKRRGLDCCAATDHFCRASSCFFQSFGQSNRKSQILTLSPQLILNNLSSWYSRVGYIQNRKKFVSIIADRDSDTGATHAYHLWADELMCSLYLHLVVVWCFIKYWEHITLNKIRQE